MRRSSLRLALALAAVLALLPSTEAGAADAHFKAGYDLYKQKKFAEAVAELEQSAEMTGQDYNFFILLANAYRGLGQWGKMVEPLNKATTIDPSKKDAHMLLGFANLKKEPANYAAAAKAFEAAVKLEPEDFQLNYYLGYAYYRSKNEDKAAPALQKAVSLKPDDFDAAYTLGSVQVKLEQCDDAAATLGKLLGKQPKQDDEILKLIMGCYQGAGQTEKAAEWAKKALEQNPNDEAALGLMYAAAMATAVEDKDYDKAIKNFEKLAADHPKDGNPTYYIGQLYELKKDFPKAIESYEKALTLESKCEWRYRLGAAHELYGAEMEAQVNESIKKAVAEDPETDFEPDEKLVADMMGHFNTAVAEYEKAVKCKSADAAEALKRSKQRLAAYKKAEEEARKAEEEAAEGATPAGTN